MRTRGSASGAAVALLCGVARAAVIDVETAGAVAGDDRFVAV